MAVSSAASLRQKVNFYVSCFNLAKMDTFSKSDPFCEVMVKKQSSMKWHSVGRSEVVMNNHDPKFVKKFQIEYFFEQVQHILVVVHDHDDNGQHDFLGQATFTVGGIMSAPGLTMTKNLMNQNNSRPAKSSKKGANAGVCLNAVVTSANKDKVYLQFSGHKLDRKDGIFGKSDPYFLIEHKPEGSAEWLTTYKSHVIRKTLYPVWKPFRIKRSEFDGGIDGMPVRITVYDWDNDGSHDLIGHVETTLPELQKNASTKSYNKKYKEWPPELLRIIHPPTRSKYKKKSYKSSGYLQINKCILEKRATLTDYLQGGMELKLSVAIDFTASNGAISQPTSLHHLGVYPNQYQQAIHAVGSVLLEYDHDKRVPVYGFGAMVDGQVSHCFPLNFNPHDPEVPGGEQGIAQCYVQALTSGRVRLHGPTYFAPLIERVCRDATPASPDHLGLEYHILLILTDGVILDFPATVKKIVQASRQPMSIIIVGVGDADFSAMEKLDSDDHLLRDSSGMTAEHDIVQFVPFRQFKNDRSGSGLAACTLAELPEQVEEFFARRRIKPRKPREAVAVVPPPMDLPAAAPVPHTGAVTAPHMAGAVAPHYGATAPATHGAVAPQYGATAPAMAAAMAPPYGATAPATHGAVAPQYGATAPATHGAVAPQYGATAPATHGAVAPQYGATAPATHGAVAPQYGATAPATHGAVASQYGATATATAVAPQYSATGYATAPPAATAYASATAVVPPMVPGAVHAPTATATVPMASAQPITSFSGAVAGMRGARQFVNAFNRGGQR